MLTHLTRRSRLISGGAALVLIAALVFAWQLQHGAQQVQATSAGSSERAISATAEATITVPPLNERRQRFAAAPSPSSAPTPTTKPAVEPGLKPSSTPRISPAVSGFRIKISSIGLEHRMEGRGVSGDGTINPPEGTVMWFKGFGRVRPGSVGTAVIAGHVTSGGDPDTFFRLSRVRVGDTVQVIGADGGRKTYKVTRASAIDKTKVTTDKAVWGPNPSGSRLAIITCDDAFGYRSDGHRKANFVVIADRV